MTHNDFGHTQKPFFRIQQIDPKHEDQESDTNIE